MAAVAIAAACLHQGAPGDRAAAQPGPVAGPSVIDQTGGMSCGLVAEGGRAFYTVGPRLVVADVSDPERPREIGRSAPAGAVVYDLPDDGAPVEFGTYAAPSDVYDLAAGTDGFVWVTDLTIKGLPGVDARDPARPHEVGSVTIPDALATTGVVVDGSTAYVVAGDGIQAVSLADPAAPREIGQVAGHYLKPATLGTTLFATAYSDTTPGEEVLRAIDVADPTRPRLIPGAPLPFTGTVWTMMAAGRWLFVASYETGRPDRRRPPVRRAQGAGRQRQPQLAAQHAGGAAGDVPAGGVGVRGLPGFGGGLRVSVAGGGEGGGEGGGDGGGDGYGEVDGR